MNYIPEEFVPQPKRLWGATAASAHTTVTHFKKTAVQRKAIEYMSDPSATYVLLDGGSRSGKTFIAIYAMFVRAIKYPNSRHVIFRLRYNHARAALCRDTIPKVIRLCFPTIADQIVENKTEAFYKFPNGSELWIGGLDDRARVDKILGNEYATIYFNEASQIDFDSQETALSRLAQRIEGCKLLALYDCNPPTIKHWVYLIWYKFVNPDTNVEYTAEEKAEYKVLKMNPTDNLENVGEGYLKILKRMSPNKRKRFLEGEYGTGAEGALFSINDLHRHRYKKRNTPDYVHCGVAIDPAAKNKTTSDETGIIGGGCALIDDEWHYFVELDYSKKAKPIGWATTAIKMYEDLQADRIIGETNNGGDMIESTMRTVQRDVSYVGVHASRGKAIRAEPIAALCSRGVLHIVGELPDLEDELSSWEPDTSTWSPNRLDAMVWLVTWLISKTRRSNPRMRSLDKTEATEEAIDE